MFILGDIGNTETKVCIVSNKNKIIKKIHFPSKEVTNDELTKIFKKNRLKFKDIKKILFCSVVPKSFNLIKKFFAKKTTVKCYEVKNLNLESVLVVGGGGAPMPPELIERTKGVFPNSEYSFGYGYGLTESGAITIINWGETLKAEPSSPGQSMPSIKIELRDENGKLIKADSVEGEIHVQSPSVMLGYYNNPEASSAALTNDRWLRTGDWGYKKGSLYFISSRRTDLILRGAENVYPQEIELILDSHKDVEESAVIGIPHDDLGQEVMAIVSTKNSQLSDSELSTWVDKDLADFKVPSKWKIINTPLPRNASGKLMKHVLIDTSKNTMVEEDE